MQDPLLAQRVEAVKAYQQRRFVRSYDELLRDARHGPAARFFLEELYGPHDFARRDEQFARIVPALSRLFPGELLTVVEALAELHALSETLDTDMARQTASLPIERRSYVAAWRATGRPSDRGRQLELSLYVGRALDRHTRSSLLRNSLRLMRGPARAAGLEDLQAFLERGLTAFAAMKGAGDFLAFVERRERALMARLFDEESSTPIFAEQALADPLEDLP